MGEETVATDTGREVGGQAVALLQQLIRIDTANPPGNEGGAQLLLAETLTAAGFDCELLAAEPGRPNLVARLGGDSAGPTLCLLSHVDTVPADPSEWSFDPWVGDVVNGEIRGRGAQDMKDQVAAEVAAAAALGRDGWRPHQGELLVVVTADEETGAAAGAQWLCREHPDKVRSDYVLNEGGGVSFELDGRRFYTLCVGEKGPCRFWIRARGVAGHASVPGLGDNALLKLAPALERLREQPPLEPTPEGVAFVAALNGREIDPHDHGALEAAVERLREAAPEVAAYLAEPMLRVTMVPTEASASQKENVIPSRAEVLVDCRVPPGMGSAEALERARAVLGEAADGLELEFTQMVVGNRSSADSPLAMAIAEWLAEADPEATLAPMVMAGFSDSHWFRRAFDSAVVYGFCPQREMALPEAMPLVHGADERAAVADVDLAARFYRDIAQAVLG
ncbi:MAG TPA: M20/M25/M40 family metallo-hydrolase [Solirubrobacterales bacterium]|nr:M20/M25/M40 family metallo-hydrolase [Solirubrobacterales bacterium]